MQRTLLACVALFTLTGVARAGMEEDVARVRNAWERIKYETPARDQQAAFERLASESGKLVAQYPRSAEPAIWHGIIEASWAGAKGGLGALSLAKSARRSLEQALALNPDALDGSAWVSLGSLYYQVPGWPIGFGDNRKALELLQRGLAVNPNGLDANFFYGDYLYRTGDLAGSEQALNKALSAPPREGRKLADDGRRREITELLEKIREKRR